MQSIQHNRTDTVDVCLCCKCRSRCFCVFDRLCYTTLRQDVIARMLVMSLVYTPHHFYSKKSCTKDGSRGWRTNSTNDLTLTLYHYNVFLCETNFLKFSQTALRPDLPDGAHAFRGCMFVTTTDEQPLTSRFWIRPSPSPCSSFDV